MSEEDSGVSPVLVSNRIISIDALRGLVMLVMLLDHMRETIFLHQQVGDPVDPTTTELGLFFARFLSSFCAPAFVFLAGTSAWLYAEKKGQRKLLHFLLTRGLFLIALELFVIGTAWTGTFPPKTFYLQIIWCIGLCMVALAGLSRLPRRAIFTISIVLIAGHNLLDSVNFPSGTWQHFLWSILHNKDWIDFFGVPARTTYPVLPWIGVIGIGYTIGPWFKQTVSRSTRHRRFITLGVVLLVSFFILRWLNIYGDAQWQLHDDWSVTAMHFFSLTKYPASLLFLLITLAGAAFALAAFEKYSDHRLIHHLTAFGGAALFFYILHLYVLKVIYLILVAIYGTNQGDYFGVNSMASVWLSTLLLAPFLWYATIRFAAFKRKQHGSVLLSYL